MQNIAKVGRGFLLPQTRLVHLVTAIAAHFYYRYNGSRLVLKAAVSSGLITNLNYQAI
ncbi:hypothetical protein [Mucilaginibacter lappiensis]|uniref:Uncharacterized protein n=1 Tax=Mucilaginibacter lappiensis TaxID=354630 RepID=A0A841JCU4_9SPHI|nr:hypothetical protein [Mucilaginibacter lappiensis]MBB6107385.1 hypothetical protein [Mucilaginibacter lappiensis]MBB6126295.1 hypothetical protein [Mucilaginibacter lappiensis]